MNRSHPQLRTRVVTLTEDTILVNSRFFGGDVNLVPKQAMTVGVATVCNAKQVLILAFGSKKARAVKEAIEGNVSHYVTLSALQLHPDGIVVLDEPAAGELKSQFLPLLQSDRTIGARWHWYHLCR